MRESRTSGSEEGLAPQGASLLDSDWLQKQIGPYDIQPTYVVLVEALQKPENEHLLFRLFPFRLTEDTLRVGCGMEAGEWEEFTLKVAQILYFTEHHNARKNVSEDMVISGCLEESKMSRLSDLPRIVLRAMEKCSIGVVKREEVLRRMLDEAVNCIM